jgi:uncharacterized repeat protein (TIGR03803 family)
MTRIQGGWVSVFAVLLVIGVQATPSSAQIYSAATLYDFGRKSQDPDTPTLGVIAQGRDGNLYSTTSKGGAHNVGAVFKITPAGKLTTLYSFCSTDNCADGAYPYGGLTLGTDGSFYGTTLGGGEDLTSCADNSGCGTIFKITPNGSLTTLYRFTNGSDGAFPEAPPIQGRDGNFYGTATAGGAPECGTIYKLTTHGAFTALHTFDNTDGCAPSAPLALAVDGNFYGTTLLGGSSYGGGLPGFGVIFKITPAGNMTLLYNFDDAQGAYSYSPLVQGSDGNLYGTATGGGTGNGGGVVFRITLAGQFIVLHAMNGTTDGNQPDAGLVQASDGNFYGVADNGGNSTPCLGSGCGTLFGINTIGDLFVAYDFDGTVGYAPDITPVQHTNGIIYGEADFGGVANSSCILGCGVFYKYDAHLPAFVTLLPYSGKAGSTIEFLGQEFTSGITTVSFNGTSVTPTVVSKTYMTAIVPSGATSGFVTVENSSGTLTSNKKFHVTR